MLTFWLHTCQLEDMQVILFGVNTMKRVVCARLDRVKMTIATVEVVTVIP